MARLIITVICIFVSTSCALAFTRIGIDQNITIYVDLTLQESGDCLTWETACNTDQDAIDLVATRYDLGGKTATILRKANQTGTSNLRVYPFIGAGGSAVIFDFNGGGISVQSGSAIANYVGPGTTHVIFQGGTLHTSDPNGYCVLWQVSGKLYLDPTMVYAGCGQAAIASAAGGSIVQIGTALRIAGNATHILLASSGGMIYGTDATTWVVFTNNPSISFYARMIEVAGIQTLNWYYSGYASITYRCYATKGGHFMFSGATPPGSYAYNDASSTCQ